jgi:peroxiredoxin
VVLGALTAKSPVVLVVLRGFPGYQCPVCTRQVGDFIGRAADFTARGAKVVMVYPGPAQQLQAKAAEFLQNKAWPAEYLFVLDPDYAFTQAYGLRWEAKNETAYPSTFVIGRDGRVTFAKISKTHGGRTTAAEILASLPGGAGMMAKP